MEFDPWIQYRFNRGTEPFKVWGTPPSLPQAVNCSQHPDVALSKDRADVKNFEHKQSAVRSPQVCSRKGDEILGYLLCCE